MPRCRRCSPCTVRAGWTSGRPRSVGRPSSSGRAVSECCRRLGSVDVLEQFTAPTAAWFRSSFDAPTKAQTEGWAAIGSGVDTLIHAPTGSGKTLAAFLWAIDRLYTEPSVPDDQRCRVLYVSPLKALAHDIDRNLRAPLQGIRHAAERMGAGPLPEL